MNRIKKLFSKKQTDAPILESDSDVVDINCMSCKYFEQGKNCSFCGHPNQTNKDFKEYLYYNFSCTLHEVGIAQSRVDYMKEKKTKERKN